MVLLGRLLFIGDRGVTPALMEVELLLSCLHFSGVELKKPAMFLWRLHWTGDLPQAAVLCFRLPNSGDAEEWLVHFAPLDAARDQSFIGLAANWSLAS